MAVGELIAKIAQGKQLGTLDIEQLRLSLNNIEQISDIARGWSLSGTADMRVDRAEFALAEFLTPPVEAFSVSTTTEQTIPNNTWTSISWTTQEYNSGLALWDSTNPTSIDINKPMGSAGLLWCGMTRLAANATGMRRMRVSFGGTSIIPVSMAAAPSGVGTSMSFAFPFSSSATFTVGVYQDSGGDLALIEARFGLVWVGRGLA